MKIMGFYLHLILSTLVLLCSYPVSAAPKKNTKDCVEALTEKPPLTTLVQSMERQTHTAISYREATQTFIESDEKYKTPALVEALVWFEASEKFDHPVWQFYFEDWLQNLGIRTSEELEGYLTVWPQLRPSQKAGFIQELRKTIEADPMTSIFNDPKHFKEDQALLTKRELLALMVLKFTNHWNRLSEQERELFLFAVVCDVLPDLYFQIITKSSRETALTSNTSKKEAIRLSWGFWKKKKNTQIDEAAFFAFRFEKLDQVAPWFSRSTSHINNRENFTFDDIHYYISQIPEKSKKWLENIHSFKLYSEQEAMTIGAFASVGTIDQAGKQVPIGRMLANTSYILKMIDKLNQPPTREEFDLLKKTIDNEREQAELIFRLNKQFPDSRF